jgi:protein-disulfide isomerase
LTKRILDYASSLAFLAVCIVFLWKMLVPPPNQTPRPRPTVPVPTEPLDLKGSGVQGSKNARAAMVVFSEFQCPFCGQFFRDTLRAFRREYVDTGKVIVRFKHLPLEGLHPHALGAAEAAECAGNQGKFWDMHDAMFNNQDRLDEASLVAVATASGVEPSAFAACLTNHAGADRVREDVALARRLQVMSTPTIMLGTVQEDGRIRVSTVMSGVQKIEVLREAISRLLK